jgi:hypothetical protein
MADGFREYFIVPLPLLILGRHLENHIHRQLEFVGLNRSGFNIHGPHTHSPKCSTTFPGRVACLPGPSSPARAQMRTAGGSASPQSSKLTSSQPPDFLLRKSLGFLVRQGP